MKIGKIIKIVFIAMMTTLLLFFAIRIFMSSDRGTLDDICPTDAAVRAYKEQGKDAFVTYKIPYDMSEDGYITAYSPSYSEATDELQITVRYNDSLSENYLKDSSPEDYYFELRDEDGNTVSKSTVVAEKERYFYNHFRLAFSDVEIDDESELYLFLICEECSYPAEHTKGIIIKHPSLEARSYRLSGAEIEALSE